MLTGSCGNWDIGPNVLAAIIAAITAVSAIFAAIYRGANQPAPGGK